MKKSYGTILSDSIGDDKRDFRVEPLTSEELQAVIFYCKREIAKPETDPELKDVYRAALDILMEHIIH